jgi:thiamine biosynthesis protein ThiI
MTSILIRFGEIGVKGQNRSYFERILFRNVRRAMERVGPVEVTRQFGRVYAQLEDDTLLERALAELETVFGISSFSPAAVVPADPENIRQAVSDWMTTRVMADPAVKDRPMRFKIETRRADKSYPATSIEICRELGAMVLERWPELVIDVHKPDVKLWVEIRDRRAWIFHETRQGAGGVAVGSAGRVCLMLSGGIDSPVAGWMMMRRGVRMEVAYMHAPPFTSHRSLEKVLELARILSRWHLSPIRVHVVSITKIQEAVIRAGEERLRVLLYRRFMTRAAEAIAKKTEALALVTGDSLGQVASQTLENLNCVEDVATMPILRPLIGIDKQEISRMAERIETYSTSIQPFPDCCSLFLPRHPKTRAKLAEVQEAEASLDVDALVAEAVSQAELHYASWDEMRNPGGEPTGVEDASEDDAT